MRCPRDSDWMPARTCSANAFFIVWCRSLARFASPEQPLADPFHKEKRFSDEDWERNPFFDFLRQTYLVLSQWAEKMVNDAGGLDEHTRHKANFYMRQITAALSPANFVATNAEGKLVNRWTSTGMLCASASSNETGYITHKAMRSMGMLVFDNQARV